MTFEYAICAIRVSNILRYPGTILRLKRHNGEMVGDRGHDTTELNDENLHKNEE